jgi:hypothetical protein
MKLLIPLALSFAVSACPGREELPRNMLGAAQAQSAQASALDRTLARELHFAAGSTTMAQDEINGFDDFLQNTEKRIRELKVILWLPPEASAVETDLVRARVGHMVELLRAHKIPYEILTLESPYYEDSQGSLLAILEP